MFYRKDIEKIFHYAYNKNEIPQFAAATSNY